MADKGVSSRGVLRGELELETKFISKVGIFYPPLYIFILHAWECAYLSIASIYKGVKMELEHQNIYRKTQVKPKGMVHDIIGIY